MFMDFCSLLKEWEMPIVKRVFNLKSIYACLVLWELKAGLVQADDPAATVMISHYCFCATGILNPQSWEQYLKLIMYI